MIPKTNQSNLLTAVNDYSERPGSNSTEKKGNGSDILNEKYLRVRIGSLLCRLGICLPCNSAGARSPFQTRGKLSSPFLQVTAWLPFVHVFHLLSWQHPQMKAERSTFFNEFPTGLKQLKCSIKKNQGHAAFTLDALHIQGIPELTLSIKIFSYK